MSDDVSVIHQAALEAEEMADMPEHLILAKRRTRPFEELERVVMSTPTVICNIEASDLFHMVKEKNNVKYT